MSTRARKQGTRYRKISSSKNVYKRELKNHRAVMIAGDDLYFKEKVSMMLLQIVASFSTFIFKLYDFHQL
jgi:hypothetical protein